VTEPQLLSPPSATCSLTLAPATGYGEEELCCGLLPDSTASEPHCFASTLDTNRVGLAGWRCHVDLAGAEAGQTFCRVVETPAEDPSYLRVATASLWPWVFTPLYDTDLGGEIPEHPVLLDAPEYCVEIELVDTRTGLSSRARRCEPDPAWEPVEVPIEEFGGAQLYVDPCEVPPAGLEDPWCEANRSYYDGHCSEYDYALEEDPQYCAAFERTCVESPPWPPPLDDAPGCACRLAAPPGRDGAGSRPGLLALLGLGVLGGARRRDHGVPGRALGAARKR